MVPKNSRSAVFRSLLFPLLLAMTTGCRGLDSGAGASSEPSEAFLAAAESYPTVLEVHRDLIAKTCSPNPGVCHQGEEYPELHRLSDLLTQIDAPCNVRHPEPRYGWDACERPSDRLELGSWTTEIAWVEQRASGDWLVGTRSSPPSALDGKFRIVSSGNEAIFDPPTDWRVTVRLGDQGVSVRWTVLGEPATLRLADSILETVVGGDPNRNGVFGSDSESTPARLVTPGELAKSYLWRRILGDVPGSRMPLANGPVTRPHYIALGCWIQTLTADALRDPNRAIDYESCDFARSEPTFE